MPQNTAPAFIDPDLKFSDQNGDSVRRPLKIDIRNRNTSNSYGVNSIVYPDDLMGDNNQYGGQYVMFYINVHEDSYLIKENKVNVIDGRSTRSLQSPNRQLTATEAQSATVVGGTLGGAITGLVGNIIPGGVVAKTATGAILSYGAIEVVGGAKKQYRQMKQAIALHIPNDLTIRYSMQWDSDSQAGLQAIGSIAENTLDVLNTPNLASLKSAGKTGASYLTGLALQTEGAGQFLSKSAGVTANPKKEQLFQQVDFRTFSFSYQFFPKSPKEAATVREIIKSFKIHMHPEYKSGTGQFLYIYPSEFDIVYYQDGKENSNLFKYTSCVLTDMTVTYTPQGQYTAFDDGMPTQININLTFKELALLSKREVEDGY